MKTERGLEKNHTIVLHAAAPAKPMLGALCNGCGVCCAARPCPITYVFLWQRSAPCRALVWQSHQQRYVCGMVLMPDRYVFWIPRRFRRVVGDWIATKISAGSGCDADIEVE